MMARLTPQDKYILRACRERQRQLVRSLQLEVQSLKQCIAAISVEECPQHQGLHKQLLQFGAENARLKDVMYRSRQVVQQRWDSR